MKNKKFILVLISSLIIFSIVCISWGLSNYLQSGKTHIPDLLNTARDNNSASPSILFLSNEWSLISLAPDNNETDTVMTILKFNNGKWYIVSGPGTSFDLEELTRSGVPIEIINLL